MQAPTKWMTNCQEIAAVLDIKCQGGHRHCSMMVKDAGIRERYPVKLVIAVLRALRDHLRGRHLIGALEAGLHVDEPDAWDIYPEYYGQIYDAITDGQLDPALVASGR